MAKKRQKVGKKKNYLMLKAYIFLFLGLFLFAFFFIFLKPNINTRGSYCYFYIPENSSPEAVYDSLKSKKLLKEDVTFWIAKQFFKYEESVEGLYKLDQNWGNLWLIRYLIEGNPRPYHVLTIPELRNRTNTIMRICKQTKIDFNEFTEVLRDSAFLAQEFKLSTESIYCIFLPGDYRVYKNLRSKELLRDIFMEYNLFWNSERRKQAKKIKQTPEDIITLASIVYAETKDTLEMPIIAGLYLNRLRKNIRLQADPTLVFARQAVGIKRIYFKYLNTVSPYNTYKHKGLPPGPIGATPLIAIEAVLNPQKHDYLYFCAKEDLSGGHYFSESFEQHKIYAKKYRNTLDKKKIK